MKWIVQFRQNTVGPLLMTQVRCGHVCVRLGTGVCQIGDRCLVGEHLSKLSKLQSFNMLLDKHDKADSRPVCALAGFFRPVRSLFFVFVASRASAAAMAVVCGFARACAALSQCVSAGV